MCFLRPNIGSDMLQLERAPANAKSTYLGNERHCGHCDLRWLILQSECRWVSDAVDMTQLLFGVTMGHRDCVTVS